MNQDDTKPESSATSSFLKPLQKKDFKYISDLVYYYSGINLHEGKKELVRARLCKRLRDLDLHSFRAYCDYIKEYGGADEVTILLDTLSTNLTCFFREQRHFDFLQREMPNIIRENKKQGRLRLRLWSTACSSGEEAYSLALIVAEYLQQFPNLDAKILGTDVSAAILRQASAGIYRKEKLRDVPLSLKSKYFSFANGVYRISDAIKPLVKFRQLNVIGAWPFKGPFDIIFCRNMMIYFDKETQMQLVERLYNYLTSGGYLFVGHSESLIGIRHNFKYVEPTVYKKL